MDKPSNDIRINTLRGRCLDRKKQVHQDSLLATARSLKESQGIASWQIRCGRRCRDRLAALRLAVDDQELLLGRLDPTPTAASAEELQRAKDYLAEFPPAGGQTGHCELDLTELFSRGIAGLATKIAHLLSAAGGERRDAHQSFLFALEGLATLCRNAAAAAQGALASAPSWRAAELRQMTDDCLHIASAPPATFRQAIQLMWLTELAVAWGDGVGLVVPGHIDRTFRPLYQADLAAGRLTRDDALLLIESLYLLMNEFVPDGLAMAVMVGGRDPEGADLTNELSYLCLEGLRRTRLIYPTVGICWWTGTPGELVNLALELIAKGYSTPAFFNDEVIQRGLGELGVPPAERCNYINSTCVEITPAGGSNVWVASPYFPLCTILLEEIAAQAAQATDGPGRAPGASFMGPDAFEQFQQAYYRRLGRHVAAAVEEQNHLRRQRAAHGGKPLQSVFTRDCVARGQDIDRGGAAYNWVECSFVGLANLADSLHVIEQEVFARKSFSLAGLKAVLDADFAGHEADRLRFLNAYPKYGNNQPAVDRFVKQTVDVCIAECRKHRMAPGDAPFVPGGFCWIMHEMLGRAAGATPDGRKAGFPFADGAGPAQGRESLGPTAAILSTTSWDHSLMIGGLAYNMKFNSSLFDSPDALARLGELVLTFLRRGGFEAQINVVDIETLRKARANPEQYRDLAVRIGGYVDYFTRLSPQMQDEIMMRTQFARL